MTIALVSGSKAATAWAASLNSPQVFSPAAATVVGNRGLLWAFTSLTSARVLSVTDNSTQAGAANVYTLVGSQVTTTGINFACFWVDLTRAVLATDSFSVAWTGGVSTTAQFDFSEWSGITTGVDASDASATGSSGTATCGTLTAGVAGDLVIGGFMVDAQNAITLGNDGNANALTSLHAPAAAQFKSAAVGYIIESNGYGTYAPTSTFTSVAWAALGIRLTAAGAAVVQPLPVFRPIPFYPRPIR